MTVPTVVVCSSARRFAGARWFSGAIPFLTRWLLANELGRPFCSATGRVVRLRSIHADAFQHQQRFHDRRIYRLDEHQVNAFRHTSWLRLVASESATSVGDNLHIQFAIMLTILSVMLVFFFKQKTAY